MRARGWHQGCNALDQLQWRECDFIQSGAVMRCYGHAGVYRKTAVAVSQHLFSI